MAIIQNKTVCIIGLGYVGLPLACQVAEKGYTIFGFDVNKEIVEKTNLGICHMKDDELQIKLSKVAAKLKATTDASILNQCNVIIVCVPTPVYHNFAPNLEYIKSSAEAIAKHIKKGDLIVVESTIFPGTIEEIVLPILEKSGLKAGADFHLAHCPERIDPGNKKWTIANLPRVVGGTTVAGTTAAHEFYSSIIDAQITKLSSVKAAEATKVVENTFRDINIAFVNELAKSFDAMGIDVVEVIKGAATKPFAFMPHFPGTGVGGHCISVDPYYLIEKAKESGFNHNFLVLAREINNSMPYYTAEKVVAGLNEIHKSVKATKITVLGVSYKPNVDDYRESPALKVIEQLKKLGATVQVYDPYLPKFSTVKTLQEALQADCLVLTTAHNEFLQLNLDQVKAAGVKVIIDGRNCLDREKIKALGIVYKGIGRQ